MSLLIKAACIRYVLCLRHILGSFRHASRILLRIPMRQSGCCRLHIKNLSDLSIQYLLFLTLQGKAH